jgi:hypothetical protein
VTPRTGRKRIHYLLSRTVSDFTLFSEDFYAIISGNLCASLRRREERTT